jgi:phosphoribosylanthranilate isomerase
MIIKVCGMRQPENILQVATLKADWLGFIFWAKSKRQVRTEDEEWIREKTKNALFKKIGVFVNASTEDMMETAIRYGLDYLQLHGNESLDVCQILHKRGFPLIKAFSIATKDDLRQTADYEGQADYFLFDSKCEGYGGSGKSFEWSVLNAYEGKTPFLLSGGIHPGSLDAIRRFCHPRFAGVDLNSLFEIEPGVKDVEKLAPFIQALRAKN